MIAQFYTKKLFKRRYWLGNIGIRQKNRPIQGPRNISNFYNLQTPHSTPSNVITNLNICQSSAFSLPCTCPNNLEQSTNNRPHHPDNPDPYSYLNASIGFNRPAFHAGYTPATNPTKLHTAIPPTIQPHGTTNPVDKTIAKELPTITPNTTPKAAPIRLINTDSHRNCCRTTRCRPPIALTNPISFVRSVTATNMIFISPTVAPRSVIPPITNAAIVIKLKFLNSKFTNVSLLSIRKLSASVTSSRRTGRKVPSA